MKPSKIEARMNLEDNERKFYRQMLGWILLIPAVGISSWLLAVLPRRGSDGFCGPAFQWDGALSGVERMD